MISIGGENLDIYKKLNNKLYLKKDTSYFNHTFIESWVNIIIDGVSNTVKYTPSKSSKKIAPKNITIFLMGFCECCTNSYVTSFPININFDSKTVSNFAIEKEDFWVKNMQISIFHEFDNIQIYDTNNQLSPEIILPMMKLDFSKPQTILRRLKKLKSFM
jgi:hypothetical protein